MRKGKGVALLIELIDGPASDPAPMVRDEAKSQFLEATPLLIFER